MWLSRCCYSGQDLEPTPSLKPRAFCSPFVAIVDGCTAICQYVASRGKEHVRSCLASVATHTPPSFGRGFRIVDKRHHRRVFSASSATPSERVKDRNSCTGAAVVICHEVLNERSSCGGCRLPVRAPSLKAWVDAESDQRCASRLNVRLSEVEVVS